MRCVIHSVRWKLKHYLQEHQVLVKDLLRETGLKEHVVRRMVRGQTKMLSLERLVLMVKALEGLTGKRVEVSDLLVLERW